MEKSFADFLKYNLHLENANLINEADYGQSIDMNNEAYFTFKKGDYTTSLDIYKKAVELKVKTHGENSVHVCISLSGVAECYLKLGEKAMAMRESKRLLKIAQAIKDTNQERIAREIITDILKIWTCNNKTCSLIVIGLLWTLSFHLNFKQ